MGGNPEIHPKVVSSTNIDRESPVANNHFKQKGKRLRWVAGGLFFLQLELDSHISNGNSQDQLGAQPKGVGSSVDSSSCASTFVLTHDANVCHVDPL